MSKSVKSSNKHIVALAVTVILLVAVTVAAFTMGSSSVSVAELFAWLTGGELAQTAQSIIVNIRAPRVFAALLAGGALAAAGAIIQATLDNPLASPNVIGINSGAGLFVLIAASVFPGFLCLPSLAAFVGALVSASIIFGLSLGSGVSRLTVVLAGIAITTVFGAGMNTILIINPDAYIGSSTFLVGGLSGVLAKDLVYPAILILGGVVVAILTAPVLNILSLGDETAHSLGMNVSMVRMGLLALAAVLSGAAVSFAGLLGFVGLVVPHVVRFLVGHDNKWVIPLSILGGAAFVVGCDLIARTAFAPYEIPVGILMAFIGGPFFIYLILRNRNGSLD